MSAERRAVGKKGETVARKHLERIGYRVCAMNYRTRLGEIDIIAEEDDTLVFIEVKTRSDARYGGPFEAITRKKRQQMSKVALEYMSRNSQHDRPARFDVVAVFSASDPPRVEIVRNAFELCYGN